MSEGHAVGRKKFWDYCSERTFVQALKSTQYNCILNNEPPPPPPPDAPPPSNSTKTTAAPPANSDGNLLWLWILLGIILLLMILFLIGFASRREQKRRKIAQAARERLSRIDNDARSTFGPGGFGGSQIGADARSGYSPLSAYPSNVSAGGRSAYTGNVSGIDGVSGGPRSHFGGVGGGGPGEDLETRSKLDAAANSTLWSRLVGGGARSAYSQAPASAISGVSTATASGMNSSIKSNAQLGSGVKRSNLTDVPKSTTSVISGNASGVGTDGRSKLTQGSTVNDQRSKLPSKLSNPGA